MLRIGYLLPAHYCFSQGNGIRQEALLKQRALMSLGHQVDLLTPWQVVERGSLDVVHFFYGGLPLANIASVASIAPGRLVFSTTIDSNQGQLAYRLAAWLGNLSGRLCTVQGEFRRQAVLADAVVVRSRHEHERVARGLGIPERKIHIVHLGVDVSVVDRDRAGGRDRNGIFHLSAYGQDRKNVLRLIAAVGPTGIPMVIAGSCSPERRRAVEAAAQPFPNISIRGFLSADERDDLYYRSRVFALPSIHEGTGLSALEAGARGCGVVITRNGGPPDYFADIGHLVDPTSITQMRDRIMAAYKDSDPRQMADHVAGRFSDRGCAERLQQVYGG